MSEITCPVCFRHCRLKEGQTGKCSARENSNGKICCTNYGKLTSVALDPIEKKPLAFFYPGSMILSIGSYGCNMDCPFCQNESISCANENTVKWKYFSPEEVMDLAQTEKKNGNIGVAYTYNEPMISYEYIRDTARLVREVNMKNVVVTNGAFCIDTLEQVLPYTDAFNIDLKGFTNGWYETMGGDLETVKRFISRAVDDSYVELTTLVIPGKNDSEQEMRNISRWIASLDRNIPLHITRFFPRRDYSDMNPTGISVLEHLKEVASEYLNTVLLGNI